MVGYSRSPRDRCWAVDVPDARAQRVRVAIVHRRTGNPNGVFQVIGAIPLRKEIDNEWFLILTGVVSVLFGTGIMLAPGAGALALVLGNRR